MHNTRIRLAGLVASLAFVVASCSLFNPPSKVKSEQLFQPGQAAYDDYFKRVHDLQMLATNWSDAKKTSRRTLIDALKIATDAPAVTISQATHERMVAVAHIVGATHLELKDDDGHLVMGNEARADATTKAFTKALMTTVESEIKRKREMRDVPPKCDELIKAGRELEPRVKTDFFKQGGTAMADVHDELEASFEVLEQLSTTARLEGRETEDFVADLGRAVAAEASEPLPGAPAASGKPAGTAKPKPPVVATQPTARPQPVATEQPKPKPKPTGGGGGDEGFNP